MELGINGSDWLAVQGVARLQPSFAWREAFRKEMRSSPVLPQAGPLGK